MGPHELVKKLNSQLGRVQWFRGCSSYLPILWRRDCCVYWAGFREWHLCACSQPPLHVRARPGSESFAYQWGCLQALHKFCLCWWTDLYWLSTAAFTLNGIHIETTALGSTGSVYQRWGQQCAAVVRATVWSSVRSSSFKCLMNSLMMHFSADGEPWRLQASLLSK